MPPTVQQAKSFREAFACKYLDKTNEENLVVAGKNVEMVGMQKIQDRIASTTHKLRSVSLQHEGVAAAGNPGEIQQLCPALTELDLSFSVFTDWSVVQEICSQLPSLASLDLSCNPMAPLLPPQLPEAFAGSFCGLRKLILNKTMVTWQTVVTLAPALPELEELHVESNHIRTLVSNPCGSVAEVSTSPPTHPAQPLFPKLANLNLDENDFQAWDDLLPLESLPKLQSLVLNRNQLSDLPAAGFASGGKAYASLTSLSVAENPIQSVEFVQKLSSCFPALTTLRISPLQRGLTYTQSRMMLLPHVPQVTTLNGTKVTPKERTDAELLYLKQCVQALVAQFGVQHHSDTCEGLPETFCQSHPRYPALVKHYGNFLAEAVGSTANSTSEAARNMSFLQTVEVTLRSFHGGSMHRGDKTKKLPINFPVNKLKLLFQSLYGLDPSRQRLVAKVVGGSVAAGSSGGSGDSLPICSDLTDDFADLQHYCLCDGTIIEMHEI